MSAVIVFAGIVVLLAVTGEGCERPQRDKQAEPVVQAGTHDRRHHFPADIRRIWCRIQRAQFCPFAI